MLKLLSKWHNTTTKKGKQNTTTKKGKQKSNWRLLEHWYGFNAGYLNKGALSYFHYNLSFIVSGGTAYIVYSCSVTSLKFDKSRKLHYYPQCNIQCQDQSVASSSQPISVDANEPSAPLSRRSPLLCKFMSNRLFACSTYVVQSIKSK